MMSKWTHGRRIVVIVLAVLMMLSGLLVMAQGTPATELVPGTPATGTISETVRAEVYRFDAVTDSQLTIQITTEEELALSALLTDAEGTLLAQGSIDAGEIVIRDVFVEVDGAHLLSIIAGGEATGDYEVILAIAEPEEEVAEATVEPTPTATEEIVEATEESDLPPPVVTDIEPEVELVPPTEILLANGIEVRLEWQAPVDMNLEVRDPLGNSLLWNNRETPVGGSFGFDANGLCSIISEEPVETASWIPTFLPTGSYEILVFYRQECEDTGPVPFTVTVTVDGETLPTLEGALNPPLNEQQDSVYLSNFVIDPEGNATLNTGGVYPDTSLNIVAAPLADLQAAAEPINLGDTVTGAIFEERDYEVYSYQATANEVISAQVTRTSGSLDTLLQIVGPNGNLVQVNDDDGQSTNSQINNLTLINPGLHYIVVTRYGKDIGGTEGQYELTVSGSENVVSPVIAELNLPQGDIGVSLIWETNADLQLLVRNPLGGVVFDDVPEGGTGGILQLDGNVNCTVATTSPPASYIYWPFGLARPGVYEVEVWYQNTCNDPTPVDFNLVANVDGNVIYGVTQRITQDQRYVVSFTLNPDRTVNVNQGGFVGNELSLINLEQELETAQAIDFNQTVTGTLSFDNAYDVYTFEGTAGQVVTIGMAANSQTLDTKLLLVGPTGALAAQNDDIDAALLTDNQRRTDSLINAFSLPQTGTYTIIATRYAFVYGGTIGGYTLSVVGTAP